MTKSEFVERLAQKHYTKRDADMIITDVLRTISEILVEGESIKFNGFGTFSVREVADKQSINIQTQERFTIPGHKTPRFIAGNTLKRAVKEGILRE